MTGFVPASWLYDVETRSTRRHPAQQATDIEVREAIEEDPSSSPTAVPAETVLTG